MKVLAFDLGGTTGWALAEDGVILASGEKTLHGVNRPERFASFDSLTESLVREHAPTYLIYERPFARGEHATRALWGYAALVETAAARVLLPVIDGITPQIIKKFATGSTKASKDEMIDHAQIFAPEVTTEHEADAVLLAVYACAHVEGGTAA